MRPFLIMRSGPGLISPGPTKVTREQRKKQQKKIYFCLCIKKMFIFVQIINKGGPLNFNKILTF